MQLSKCSIELERSTKEMLYEKKLRRPLLEASPNRFPLRMKERTSDKKTYDFARSGSGILFDGGENKEPGVLDGLY
jgi:hypothetical protein